MHHRCISDLWYLNGIPIAQQYICGTWLVQSKATRDCTSCVIPARMIQHFALDMQIESNMEGKQLPASLVTKLQSIVLNVSNGKQLGMWSADNLALLGIELAPEACTVAIQADAAIVNLDKLHQTLADSGLLKRVCSLSQECWGIQGRPAHFGMDIEVLPSSLEPLYLFGGFAFIQRLSPQVQSALIRAFSTSVRASGSPRSHYC